ncbi:hypothetical protein [Candidatus Methylacidithermus pantelleriae]|uniref:hypothetical protein n=1 Tax=Candidatus Methylacidithermus pantelleriae TaxID=2744239 RepID=UPI001BD33D67|nr:hypothetical protein [Candidatus Methylacidithermus pantelleriae]
MAQVFTRTPPRAFARRGLAVSEGPLGREAVVRTGQWRSCQFCAISKQSDKPWMVICMVGFRKRLKAADTAHALSRGNGWPRAAPSRENPGLGAAWALPVKRRHANRRQRCSAGVRDDPLW